MSFEFKNHCNGCPRSTTHCCTKKGNIVLINDGEKNSIVEKFESLKATLTLPDNYTLFNDEASKDGVTPLRLIAEKNDEGDDIDRCPFFRDPDSVCLIHLNKPQDCKLWPISKFENGDKMLVYVDTDCTAINAKESIPLHVVNESIEQFNSLNDAQKAVYFSQSGLHYHLGAIPVKIWDKFQECMGTYKEKLDRAKNEIKDELERLERKFVTIDFNSKEVLYITKWMVGIFFASIIGALINQSVGNVESFKIGDLDLINGFSNDPFLKTFFRIFAICAITVVFIGDVYRIIIPLPWIIKDYSENSSDFRENNKNKFKDRDLPSYQVTKLAVIGVLSFFLLAIMAIRFVYEPVYYLLIYGIIMLLDLSWYYVNKKRLHEIVYLSKIILPILTLVAFMTINDLSFQIPLLICCLAAIFFFILFNSPKIYPKFPLEERQSKRFSFMTRGINKLFYFFLFPSVETERERIKNRIQVKLSDEIFQQEEEELTKHAKYKRQSVDRVIELFEWKKNKLKEDKEKNFQELEDRIDISQKCEKYLDDQEKTLAKELSFKRIAWVDFIICIVPSTLLILNKHYLQSELILEEKRLILSSAFLVHTIVMLVELYGNNFYKDYLKKLFIKNNA